MVQLTDPDGTITIDVDPNGTLRVDRSGETVFEPSPYGLPTPYGSFPEEFELDDVRTRRIDESYELVHGKRSSPRHRAVEKTLSFEGDGGSVDLQVRAADDGIAYRYRLRGERDEYLHPGDESGFRFPPGAVAWLSDYQANHEGHSRQVPVTAVDGEYNLPGLFHVDDTWALVCEAGVDGDWMAGRLVGTRDDAPGVDIGFPESHPTSHVWADDPATTPWRVAIVGDLATVVESTLPTDLVDGPRIDGDWVEPGRVAWSWWASGSSVRSLEEEREYVDYAAERGWEYVLVDAGWDDEWLPDLVAYANDAGVDVELWSHFIDLNTESKREERLSRWAEWGVAGIKVDFMDSDDQGRMQFYDDLARAAAEHELTVNYHGSAVPTGLRRRWPHVMTYEGVRGAEYYKWTTNTPEHNATLPFTRNVVGPMDYTPVTFSAERRATSAGHELALSVVYESGLQHYADGIESYETYPIAERVLESVPAAWDETRFLRGRPGSEATFARRKGDGWFVGSITAGPAESIEVPLSFLDGETTAVVATDADEGDGLEEYERAVSPDESLRVSVAENGGFVVRL
ncbi:Glycoside hydrolase 97 (plasmid) [Haloterrigena turkmenica DSM 5511]|uniref:Glycoside hydrolase 97 n=1 Tax=Haloterrigena turkmenica (strain ATCC 51198 / DSM 5511 / JCM 9101 / NCIMB 13204 / VKM B-1734 / 4k) TaxID=543526 RepID=D2S037_HALTV|nr:glycoside hydrolase family 97 protein [Haloterrigena turkmenica]ADB62734.1 Glycoside hydrolase 97 [Haloterrigena turkmenica DSM 5511]